MSEIEPNEQLFWAVRRGDVSKVKESIDAGADINAADDEGYTPLHLAIIHNRRDCRDVIDTLITNGASVNVANNNGYTPLHLAIIHEKSDPDIVKLFLNIKGVNVNVADNNNGYTPLHLAALYGYKDVIELLLEKGAEVDAQDNIGRSALCLATQENFVDVGKYLLEKGANPFLKDIRGKTLIEEAEEKQPKTSFLSKHKGKIGIGIGISAFTPIVVGVVLGLTTSLPVLAIIGIALVSGFIAGGIACGVAYVMSRPNAEQHDKGAGNMQGT